MTYVIPPVCTEHQPGPDVACVACCGIMQANAHHPGTAASTLSEANLLRNAGGVASGGMNTAQLVAGMQKLFGWAPQVVVGWAKLRPLLVPGKSATVSGIPANAPAGSPIRRFVGAYPKGHRVFIEILDAGEPWLMDPEGPVTGYSGQRVPWADLAAFASDQGRWHTLASVAVKKFTRKVAIAGGYMWTAPRSTSGSVRKAALLVGQVATVTSSVTGGAWSFGGKSGTTWYRISEINGVKLAVPLYGAKGRFG